VTSGETEKFDQDALNSSAVGGKTPVAIICVVMIVAVLLYGAVDTGTLALISLLSFGLVVYWGWISVLRKAVPIDLNSIQLPLLGLLLIGLIQLLPLGNANVPADAIRISVSHSLSLDPYATRFFLTRLFFCIVFLPQH
jgi:hypothetical protein